MSYYIISCDPSLNSSGLTVFECNNTSDKGISGFPVHYECITPSDSLEEIDKLHYNYKSFCRIFSIYHPIKYIAFECQIPQMRYNTNASGILKLAENIGVLKLAILEVALKYNKELIVLGVPPGDIKKFATGNSRSDKDAMMDAVDGRHMKTIKAKIPEGSVNDVADSYHLGKMVISFQDDYSSFDKYIINSYS